MRTAIEINITILRREIEECELKTEEIKDKYSQIQQLQRIGHTYDKVCWISLIA